MKRYQDATREELQTQAEALSAALTALQDAEDELEAKSEVYHKALSIRDSLKRAFVDMAEVTRLMTHSANIPGQTVADVLEAAGLGRKPMLSSPSEMARHTRPARKTKAKAK